MIYRKGLFATVALFCSSIFLSADIAGDEGATVRGKISQYTDKNLHVPFEELKISLLEQVKLPTPPFPKNWQQLQPEQRDKWWRQFIESPEGKKFEAERKKVIEAANKFDIKPEQDGKFVVYDVPAGRFGLRGRVDKTVGGRKYAFEVFGQVDVEEEVEEVLLDPIMILPTRLLVAGDECPQIDLKTAGGLEAIKNEHFNDKYFFLNFWSVNSKPSTAFQSTIQEMYMELKSRHNFELLSINLDQDQDKAIEFIKKEKIRGAHGFAGKWEHPTVDGFGVRSIPSYWLIGRDGKILMTNHDFRVAFRSGKPDLTRIVSDRITGKDTPTLAPERGNGSDR